MKKTINFLFVVFLFSGIYISSCDKNAENQSEFVAQSEASFKAAPTPPVIINVTCSGTCADGERCFFSMVGNNQYGECSCEGCTLVVELDGGVTDGVDQNKLLEELFSRELFSSNLQSFVNGKFKTTDFDIQSLEYAVFEEGYYVSYDIVTFKGEEESVMYASYFTTGNKEAPKKFEIDCAGHCESPTETCRERFIFNPPSTECTCEGSSCIMTVTEL